MAETGKHKRQFGLVGKNISYSFSRVYFSKKFEKLGLTDHTYSNFDLKEISELKNVLSQHDIKGLNVTIPYKETIIPFLDDLDDDAKTIGAVNTIKCTKDGLKGYNTDAYGFKKSLEPLLGPEHKNALVLGTGGASKAIVFVLRQLGLTYQYVSRNPLEHQLGYAQLDDSVCKEFQLVINCSPVGTYPNVAEKPKIPYDFLNEGHILFDLIYNPPETTFLKEGRQRGAMIQNGLPMLEFQAEEAWKIWNSN